MQLNEGLSGGETYNDANARLEFFNDATYKYYRKNDGGLWEAVTNREFQEYIADGTTFEQTVDWERVEE